MNVSAPYNFVPLANWVHIPEWSRQVSHDLPFQDGLSGEIAYRLVAESDLLVGGKQQSSSDENPGEVYPFSLPDGRYAVSGSSLKGMLRGVLEIAGFGRLRRVDDHRFGVRDLTSGARKIYGNSMTKAVNGAFKSLSQAGWLQYQSDKQAWCIQPCDYARVEHDDLAAYSEDEWWKKVPREPEARIKYERWKSSDLNIVFDPGPVMGHPHSDGKQLVYRRATNLGTGAVKGALVFTGQPSERLSGKSGRKHMEFIFFDERHNFLSIDERVWADFVHIHSESTEWLYWKKQSRIPVFYLTDTEGEITSLGLALMYRLAYKYSIHQAISHSSEDHLKEPGLQNGYDLADLLFGAVNGNDQNDAIRGRVSCEIAVAEGAPTTVKQPATILNGPKPTYYPNYICQKTDRDTIRLKNRGDGYATLMSDDVRIRGFKRYPARPDNMVKVQKPIEEQQRNTKVQVRLFTLPKGTSFTGRIVFHNLKREELGALLWVMSWGGQKQLRHGLGMGKPFGFGQTRIELDHGKCRFIPNRPDMTPSTPDDGELKKFMNLFSRHMDAACQQHGHNWHDSPELVNLLAMADPEAAGNLPEGVELRHMRLEKKNNEFVKAKKSGAVLPDYAVAIGRSPDGRGSEKNRAGGHDLAASNSETLNLHPWVRQTASELMETHKAPISDVLRGKPLTERWQAIDDPQVKTDALTSIRTFWERKNWWNNPPGKAAKRAKKIYEQGV